MRKDNLNARHRRSRGLELIASGGSVNLVIPRQWSSKIVFASPLQAFDIAHIY